MGALKSTTCSKGHLLAGENLYHHKDGTRECRECSLARYRNRVKRTRQKAA